MKRIINAILLKKNYFTFITTFMVIFIWSCEVIPGALNRAYLGMTVEELMQMSNYKASLYEMQDSSKVYKYDWVGTGYRWPNETTYFYFKNNKLIEINQGKAKAVNQPQLKLNYNLN
jgi:hypothetical protein